MRTIEEVILAVKDKTIPECFPDGRNVTRLLKYIPVDQWSDLGFEPREGADLSNHPTPYTEENVRESLAHDLDFAFEKAHGERGISSAAMFEVIRTWLYCLGDDETRGTEDDYHSYGMPLYREVAEKYGIVCESA